MPYRDVPFPEDLPSFMGHAEVLKYLQEYGSGLPILCNHQVVEVKRMDERWQVTSIR